MNNSELACIVLNYNCADICIELLGKIKKYKNIDYIIVVDNDSNDDSFCILDKYIKNNINANIELIKNKKNLGYSSGNNLGIKYAKEVKKCKYALVANPDVEFKELSIDKLLSCMKKYKSLALISPIMILENNNCIDTLNAPPAFKELTFFGEILDSLPISRRIFNHILNYKKDIYTQNVDIVEVFAVAGSLLMLDIDKFLALGGYDDDIFLYMEEKILAKRLKANNYKSAILCNDYYIHKHNLSIGKSFDTNLKRQKIREESTLIYFKKYLNINKLKLILSKAVFFLIRIEIYIYSKLKM